ncbi:MAG: hypothetical protein JEZ05_11090 [Tenericutes bacterium]|nr:hypothetical protein [Mycoplasmatota bacterium]
MKLIKLKTKKDYIYINPESIAYIQKKNSKEDVTLIGFNSGNSVYVNYIEVFEPVRTVLKKFEFED